MSLYTPSGAPATAVRARKSEMEISGVILCDVQSSLGLSPVQGSVYRTGPVYAHQITDRHGASDMHVECHDVAIGAERQE